ncbi:hypothetical protein HHK36_010426 [Tetracentron sinense]|uniref:Uncharacterized protein n=1 Tax=Tetracentron sinense TaxID=13715 RepID=A0A834ZCT9_TETSI|nr:hypothetical protein HHK36_010426 [Tetracentron sinense]
MGCTSSKLDDLPAVALCRERCIFLEEAIQQRYALAEAHVAYIQSLKEVGLSLNRLLDQDLDNSIPPPSPVLPLPTQRKGDPVVKTTDASFSPPAAAVGHHSHSNSGSHLHFHSDSDDDDSGSLHHSGHSSPLHSLAQFHHDYNDQETLSSFPGAGGFMNMNYMKKRPTPSVAYEQRPMGPEETVHMTDSSYYPYSYPNQNPSSSSSSSSYPYGYPNYGGGGGIGGFFPYGSSSPPPPPPHAAAPASASSSKPPPPPPSPPKNSTWDFLNFFDNSESYYPSYAPSPDPNEVRQKEGIPDLEDVGYQHEVVKEVHGHQKFVDGDGNYSKMVDDDDGRGTKVPVEIEGAEYEVHLADKNVDAANKERSNVAAFKGPGGSRGVSEVVRDIEAQFERASESGNEISKMLEVGKQPYHQKNAVYKVSSKMLHVITPSLSVVSSQSQPSTSTIAESSSSAGNTGSIFLDFDEDAGMRSGNLSSTLKKLSMWEKKLYDEVKAEEKMRILHERKRRRLKRLDERGAEAHKVDSTRTLIRTLSTKIRIAIQVVDKISIKINKLRDEELWPQINELIPGIIRMWKVMLECHRNQCQAITEAKSLDAIASNKPTDAHLEAIMLFGLELINWISRFSSWIGSQKGFVNALNAWLLKCLLYEPEETPDGIAPFSPGRIGAPPVFVICNQWSQAMERISEKEVVDAMRVFAVSVFQIWEQQNMGIRQKLMGSKELESKSKTLERGEQKIQKAMQALDKKMVMVSGEGSWLPIHGQIVHQRDTTNISSLQSGLKQIFETMERFTANSMQAYEELWVRSEEDRLARENAKVP